jgi:2-polyprenyl-3-methyl-5-hydroxy-6-metoxy-1,4-benzoquinol methylase
MSQKERRAAAARGGQGNVGAPADAGWAAMAFNEAVRHHNLGEFLAAEANCRAILGRDPRHVGSLHMLGAIAQQGRRFDEAASCFQAMVGIRPDMALAHHGLGTALVALGRFDEAAAAFERALAAKAAAPGAPGPDEALTALNLGYLYEQLGRPEQAIDRYRRALAANPDFAEAYNNLAALLLAQGRRAEASAAFARSLALAPELIADFEAVKDILFRIHPALAEAARRADAAWPERLAAEDALGPDGIGAIAADPLLRFILESTPVIDMPLERCLTGLRAALLGRAESGAEVGDDLLGFACALACQCFINEYVFCDTGQEQAESTRLSQALLAALAEGRAVPPLWRAALASYAPLGALEGAQRLLERSWPEAVDKLLTQQLREVEEERRLRESMPRLTSIGEGASARVRAQYEENPYPRWVLPPSQRAAITLNQFLAGQFPGVGFRPVNDLPDLDILIAGCGTGHHPIEMARRYVGARVLAVDLSLASLAYASRKSRELGVGNVTYGQADILELSSLERSFDVVDASGVLHHLADPLEGWRRLCALTRPGGVMRIGLYSALGRAEVAAARRFIAERGFEPTAADIRRCRQELVTTPMRALEKTHDFNTASECRDLLVHVEEHHVSIGAIAGFLAAQGLGFVGFEVSMPTRQAYLAANPGDPAMTDLGRWSTFETEHPSTFAGMYQFWCQKP